MNYFFGLKSPIEGFNMNPFFPYYINPTYNIIPSSLSQDFQRQANFTNNRLATEDQKEGQKNINLSGKQTLPRNVSPTEKKKQIKFSKQSIIKEFIRQIQKKSIIQPLIQKIQQNWSQQLTYEEFINIINKKFKEKRYIKAAYIKQICYGVNCHKLFSKLFRILMIRFFKNYNILKIQQRNITQKSKLNAMKEARHIIQGIFQLQN